ncbi:hypothetical protein Bca101_097886 [Brassica carinata]
MWLHLSEFTNPVPMYLSWQMERTLSASSGMGSLIEARRSIKATSRSILLVALWLKSLIERTARTYIMVAKHVFHEISRVIRYMTIISCRVPYGEVYLCLTGIFPLNLDGKLSIRICGCRLYL